MAWYRNGTISVTNGSAVVTGSGTLWVDAGVLNSGDITAGPDGNLYEILSIQSNTALTLASNYLGSTASGQSYAIMPIGLLPSALAQQVKTTLASANTALQSAILSTAGQSLTSTQQANARANIAALGAGDVGKGYLSKSVAGGVDVTLSTAEDAAEQLELTGTLTANINVIVSTAARQRKVKNSTSGAYTVTVKTAAGTGLVVAQGKGWTPLACDGTNVANQTQNTPGNLRVGGTLSVVKPTSGGDVASFTTGVASSRTAYVYADADYVGFSSGASVTGDRLLIGVTAGWTGLYGTNYVYQNIGASTITTVSASGMSVNGVLQSTAGCTAAPSSTVSTLGVASGGYSGTASVSLGAFGATRGQLLLGGNYTSGATSIGGVKFLYGPRSTTDENTASIATIQAANTATDSTSGGYLTFSTAPTSGSVTERLRIDSIGNIGFGASASVWGAAFKAFEFSGGNSIYSNGSQVSLASNAYNDGSWKYKANGTAGLFTNTGGSFTWYTGANNASGAGAAYSYLTSMNLDASGNLTVNMGTLGYGTGAGGTVTQATSRTTGVTINKPCGAITLVSAAGSASWQSFTVTNSTVAATDTIMVCQKSGTDLYQIDVTAVAAGSFRISFATTGGTTTEQPIFNFSVLKGVTA